MTEIETNTPPHKAGFWLPLWYCVLVCLGSAWIGGFFGSFYGAPGILVTAFGGAGAAVLWLNRVSRFEHSDGASVFGGIIWGAIVGIADTFWMHLAAWVFGYQSSGEAPVGLLGGLLIGSICGVLAGAVYGLFCITVLQVYLVFADPERFHG
jgi:hypothetical protein